ncbi:death domain-containing protein CRADD-like [Coturnix japonica]|uniref:death domain-containing protein CRADD-like n=1 Tax=Coturnix japonica TaxID=93934 RepID=UPI0013A5D760|nr:death domain-containing protein CRADD-like [Coturnix japonica]
MSVPEREVLLSVQRALPEEQFETFKYFLEEQLPLYRLRAATRPELCAMLLQHFPNRALHVAADVLRKLPRHDLIQRYRLPGAGHEQVTGAVPQVTTAGAQDAGVPQHVVVDPPESAADPPGCGGGRLLSERDLLRVAQLLGHEWQEVGVLCLGLPRCRLEQIQENNPHRTALCSFEMLRDWRRREGAAATAPRLRDCLQHAQLDPEVFDLLQQM